MRRFLSIGATFALASASALALPASEAKAQVMVTPPGCQWMDAGAGRQDLYCRDADDRTYRTETTRRDMGGTMDVCVRGQMDDGMGCVSEAAARRSQAFSLQYDPNINAPPPFDWKANKTTIGKWRDPNRPDVMIFHDGYGNRRRNGGWNTGYIMDVPD